MRDDDSRMFRRAIGEELRDELTQRCIIYDKADSGDYGEIQIRLELTDEAHTLLGMYAMAAEFEKRDSE